MPITDKDDKFIFWGVDDKELYLKNLDLFKEVQAFREDVGRYIKEIRRVLDNMETAILTEEQDKFIEIKGKR